MSLLFDFIFLGQGGNGYMFSKGGGGEGYCQHEDKDKLVSKGKLAISLYLAGFLNNHGGSDKHKSLAR